MKRVAQVVRRGRWWALWVVVLAGLAVSAGATARGGRGLSVPPRGPQPRHKGFIPDGTYGATVTYSLGTISEKFILSHHRVVEIDTSGSPNGGGCFKNDPSTGDNNPIGAIQSFKVRVDPPFPTRLGVTIGRVSSPITTGVPVKLSDVIEATPPGGTSLPLTHAAMSWGFAYGPGNFLFPIYHNTTIRGPRVVGLLLANLEWGDYSNGGISCGAGAIHLLLRRPPITYSGEIH